MTSNHQTSATPRRKRPRQGVAIGVSTFCSILQDGSNPQDVHRALSHFVRVIPRERRQALVGSSRGGGDPLEEETDDSGDDDASLLEQDQPKKQKLKENWMEDTRGYAVPFVGTSVGVSRGQDDSGSIRRNQWPTGWLESYLQKSPMATELLQQGLDELGSTKGRLHRKLLQGNKASKQLSASILRLFYRALGELLSVSVPLSVLKRDLEEDEDGDESMEDVEREDDPSTYDKFLSQLLLKQEILPKLLRLLGEETSFGKANIAGPLAPSLVRVLTRLAQSSMGTAREVVRGLEGLKDGTFRVLLRNSSKISDASSPTKRWSSRNSILHLACVLLEWQDATTLSYVASAGNRERKINPGLLHQVCKYGLIVDDVKASTTSVNDKELGMASRLLEALWELLPDARVGKSPKAADHDRMQRILSDILSSTSSDALLHLAKLARFAPPMKSHKAVLDGDDDSDDMSELLYLGTESRRFVFTVLLEVERSPLLQSTAKRRGDDRWIQGVVVKVLNELLQSDRTIAMQLFVIHALQANPNWMGHFSKSRAVTCGPAQSNVFSFLGHMGWIRRLLVGGPRIASSFPTDRPNDSDDADSIKWDVIMLGRKKQALTKCLQNKHPLVVMEVLKVLIRLVERFHSFACEREDEKDLRLNFASRIPNVAALLSVMQNFHLFGKTSSQGGTALCIITCRALRTYGQCLSASFERMDWSKLLPRNVEGFLSSDQMVQLHILDCFSSLLEYLPKEKLCVGEPELEFLLDILVATRVKEVHSRCRQVAVRLLTIFTGGSDKGAMHYELSLWVDGMTTNAVKDFCVAATSSDSPVHVLMAAKAWREMRLRGRVGRPEYSSILSKAVGSLDKVSGAMRKLTYQVSTRLLLFSNRPLQLASFVLASSCDCDELKRYCSTLIDCDDFDSHAAVGALEACARFVLGQKSLSDPRCDRRLEKLGCIDMASEIKRSCHLLVITGEDATRHQAKASMQVRTLLPRLGTLEPALLVDVLHHTYWSCDFVDPGLLSTALLCARGEQLHVLERSDSLEKPMTGILRFALLTKLPVAVDRKLSLFILGRCSDSDYWTSLAHFWVTDPARDFSLILTEMLDAFLRLAIAQEASTRKLTLSLDMKLLDLGAEHPERITEKISQSQPHTIGSACLYSLSLDPKREKSFLHLALECHGLLRDWFERMVSDEKYKHLLESGALDQALTMLVAARNGDVDDFFPLIESRLLMLSKQTDSRYLLRGLELIRLTNFRDTTSLSSMLTKAANASSTSVLRELVGCIKERGCPEEVAAVVFVALCRRVPKILKRLGLTGNDSMRYEASQLLDVLCEMCKGIKIVGFPQAVEAVDAAVKSCLKHGITHSRTVPSSSLRFVSNLLDCVFSGDIDSERVGIRERFQFLQPKIVFTMVTTHSHFIEVLSNADDLSLETRTQMLNVLRVALSNSPSPLALQGNSRSTLCATHKAGMTKFDRTARFLILWEADNLDESQKPQIHDMDWNKPPGEQVIENDQSHDCQWIANALDFGRVRATLQQFPTYDHLHRASDRDSGRVGTHSEYATSTRYEDEWLERGSDTRYSPAFVLPIVGTALECLRPIEKEAMGIEDARHTDEDLSPEGNLFARLSQSLCSRGILSLALASTCSHNGNVRQTALACLTLFHRALHSGEAKAISNWQDRPQLCLLLNSVQRGMAIVAEKQGNENCVLRVPPLSALFFAKAASVLTRPGDPMYGPINRYFLKLESGCGAAFTNNSEFYRLPAFVSLMCSSDEHTHQRERIWAMQTLKESFLEAQSYRAVAACHAPEMVLSTLQGALSRSFAPLEDLEAERIAGLHLFARLLRLGSRPVSSLLGRLGLVSWLRTFVGSGGLSSKTCHETFLDVVEAAILLQRRILSEDGSHSGLVQRHEDRMGEQKDLEWEIEGLLFDLDEMCLADKSWRECTPRRLREVWRQGIGSSMMPRCGRQPLLHTAPPKPSLL